MNEHDGDSNQMRIKTLCSPRYMKCFFRLQTSKELLSRFASPLTGSTNHSPEMSISSVMSLFHFLLFLRQDPTVLRQEFPIQSVSSPLYCRGMKIGPNVLDSNGSFSQIEKKENNSILKRTFDNPGSQRHWIASLPLLLTARSLVRPDVSM